MHKRVIAVEPVAMAGREVLAVAGGAAKSAAILAVLRGRLLSALITDEPAARRVIEARSERAGRGLVQHQREKGRP